MVIYPPVDELTRRLDVSDSLAEIPGLPGVLSIPTAAPAVVVFADTAGAASWARARFDILSSTELARAAKFVVPGLGLTWSAAHVVLREVLGRMTLTPPAEVRMRSGKHGKPVTETVEFSLSHTGSLVLIGVSDQPVGADIEAIPEQKTVAQISESLHPRESAELLALPRRRRPEAFTRVWVRKEAMLKAFGTGLLHEISADYVGTDPTPTNPAAGYELHDITLPGAPRHRAALCTSSGDSSPL